MAWVVGIGFIVLGVLFVANNKRMAQGHAKFYHASSEWIPLIRAAYYFLGPVGVVAGVVSLVLAARR
ncbi:MAG: hypothetical protein KKA32_15075 [Actinobacteria bacterium]|nr:hypothetical protein [Actinomycetota bacterium]